MPERRADGDHDLAALLEQVSRGDDRAWRTLLDRYAPRVFAMARSRVGQPELAEEITQSVFATVAEKLMTGKYSDRGRFEPWLFRVTMNRVRDEFRRRKRHPAECFDESTHDSAAPDAGSVSDLARAEHPALRRAMESLSDADRTVVEMRHHGGMGFKQIAAALEEPMGTVLARHHRALRKLKAFMESLGVAGAEGAGGATIPMKGSES